MKKSILIVDDDELMRSFLSTILSEEGYHVEVARDGKTGLAILLNSEFDLVITDLKMPDISGLDLMHEGKKAKPETRWVIIKAYGSIGNAVKTM